MMTCAEAYEAIYADLMKMKKAEIVQQGVAWKIYSSDPRCGEYVLKNFDKKGIAHHVADRAAWNMVRLGTPVML